MQHTIRTITVHRDNENPVYGEERTDVTLEDEGGGPFVSLTQDGQTIKLDFNEINSVVEAISKLRDQEFVTTN